MESHDDGILSRCPLFRHEQILETHNLLSLTANFLILLYGFVVLRGNLVFLRLPPVFQKTDLIQQIIDAPFLTQPVILVFLGLFHSVLLTLIQTNMQVFGILLLFRAERSALLSPVRASVNSPIHQFGYYDGNQK